MAFKAVIHGLEDRDNYKNIIDSISKYRVRKSFKVLNANGIQRDTVLFIVTEGLLTQCKI